MFKTKHFLLLFSLILIFVGLAFLPKALETTWGKKWLAAKVSSAVNMEVQIGQAEMSWFGPQVFKHVKLKEAKSGLAKIEEINVGDSLFALIFSQEPSKVKVQNLEGLWETTPPIRASNVSLDWDVKEHSIRLTGKTHYGSDEGKVDITLGQFDLKNISAETLDVEISRLPVNLLEHLLRLGGNNLSLSAYFGPYLDASVKKINGPTYQLNITSPLLLAKGFLEYDGKTFFLKQPLEIKWNGNQMKLTGSYDLESAKGVVYFDRLPLALLHSFGAQSAAFLKGDVDGRVLFDLSQSKYYGIDATLTSDNFKAIPLHFRANIPRHGETSKIQFQVFSQNPEFQLNSKGVLDLHDSQNPIVSLDASGDIRNFPFEKYVTQELSYLLGSKNSVLLNLSYAKERPLNGLLEVNVKGQHVDAEIALALDAQLRLKNADKQAVIRAKLPPDLCKSLFANTPMKDFSWSAPIPVNLTIDHIQIPFDKLHGEESSQLIASLINQGVQGRVSIGPLETYIPNSKSKLLLGLIDGSVTMEGDGKRLRVSLASHGGSMSLDLKGIVGLRGSEPINMQFNGSRIPVELVSMFAKLDPNTAEALSALFGGEVDLNGSTSLVNGDGNVTLALSSPSAKASFDGRLQNGVLYLNQPLQMQAEITQKVIRNLLAPSIPVFAGLISSEGPISLSIDPKGFAVPVRSFDITKASISAGVISVGTLGFSPSSELGSIVAVLTTLPNGPLYVKSTPLYFKLDRGIVTLFRWDMLLVDTLPVACWGTVDFGRRWVDLTLGLTPRAVEVAFNVPGLNPDHLLQIPIRGPLGNVSIDKRGAAAQLTALVAKSRKGAEGLLIGTFLQLTSGMMKDLQAPPPTTQPLPWETASQRPANSKVMEAVNEGVAVPIEVMQKGSDALQKGANSLINQIFR